MINEMLYCERLAYLEWVQGEWADNAWTEEGRWAHRRADEKSAGLPEQESEKPYTARSVWLSSERLGLAAKIDVVEGEGEAVVPIEYKRGSPPEVPEGAYVPERAQLCVQVLLLREHGFRCDEAQLYFAGARRRVSIVIDDTLIAETLAAAARARALAERSGPPPPLVDSPKCNGCSLVGICLPDETNALHGSVAEPDPDGEADEQPSPRALRRLHPARDDRRPVYVHEQGARVGIEAERLVIRGKDVKEEARLVDTSHVALFGNINLSAQAARTLAERGISVMLFSYGGWFSARIVGLDGKNVELRMAQHRAADDPKFCLELARTVVATKIRNARTMLRRNHSEPESALLKQLEAYAKDAERAEGLPSLLGIEGSAARAYFGAFTGMFRAAGIEFALDGRNRRPPKDQSMRSSRSSMRCSPRSWCSRAPPPGSIRSAGSITSRGSDGRPWRSISWRS
jgi:CRISPR-associated protein Cas1